MKTTSSAYEEVSVPSSEEGKTQALYRDFFTASVESTKLAKKLQREQSKIDRLGFAPKKLGKIKKRLEEATSVKLNALAEIHDIGMAS